MPPPPQCQPDQLLTLNAENKEQERKCYQRWVTATEQRLLKAVCTKRMLFFFFGQLGLGEDLKQKKKSVIVLTNEL